MRQKALCLLLMILAVGLGCHAQSFDLDKNHVRMAELKGLWRFHTGDDLSWSESDFDDSHWGLIQSEGGWADQGYRRYSGVAWYRAKVSIPLGQKGLAILVPEAESSYQVFANGQLIGQVGGMPPHAQYVNSYNNLFPIPDPLLQTGQPVSIAIRVWEWPLIAMYGGGGLSDAPMMGNAESLEEFRNLLVHDAYWWRSDRELLLLANLLAAILGLALFVLRPREREYLWFGAAQVLWTVTTACEVAAIFYRLPFSPRTLISNFAFEGAAFLNLEFFLALMKQRRGTYYWAAAVSLMAVAVTPVLALMGWITFPNWEFIATLANVPYALAVPAILLAGARRGNMEARVLMVPFSISCLGILITGLISAFGLRRFGWIAAYSRHYSRLFTWPFPMSGGELIGLLCLASVVVVLLLRFARSRRDEERLEAELEAARVVQQVLVPEEIPTIPGFQIQSVYKPAGQVGGDFFQIIPGRSGGALIAIGDVSGKGMPAAMTVSLLVGTFRTLAHYTHSPSEILAAMNQRMLARSQGGFTTCLVLRLDQDGSMVLANAGHIAPYIGGREVEVVNGLPLGLSAESKYDETVVQLSGDDQLMLLTDGVVEARSNHGELFGFDRAASISTRTAIEVASAAQKFGQEDDITVLSLKRRAFGGGADRIAEFPSWSSAQG